VYIWYKNQNHNYIKTTCTWSVLQSPVILFFWDRCLIIGDRWVGQQRTDYVIHDFRKFELLVIWRNGGNCLTVDSVVHTAGAAWIAVNWWHDWFHNLFRYTKVIKINPFIAFGSLNYGYIWTDWTDFRAFVIVHGITRGKAWESFKKVLFNYIFY